MSTYYFLICDAHKESVATSSSGGPMEPAHVISQFVYAHSHPNCLVRIGVEDEGYDCEQWEDENWKEMKAKSEARFEVEREAPTARPPCRVCSGPLACAYCDDEKDELRS